MGYEEMAVQISGGKINTYTQKRVLQLNIFLFQCAFAIFSKLILSNGLKKSICHHSLPTLGGSLGTLYTSNKMVIQVYVFFFSLLFGFEDGWVGHRKSEHCSDFENTYTKMDDPLEIYMSGYMSWFRKVQT